MLSVVFPNLNSHSWICFAYHSCLAMDVILLKSDLKVALAVQRVPGTGSYHGVKAIHFVGRNVFTFGIICSSRGGGRN